MHDRNALIISHISVLIRSEILTLCSRASEILTTQNLSAMTAAICLWIHTTVIARNPGWQSSEMMCALSPEVWEDKWPCVLSNYNVQCKDYFRMEMRYN